MKIQARTKIISLEKIAKIISNFKSEGKKIVLCHGVFDLLHPGHIRHFNSAKKYGDILVVTITSDKFVRKGPGRPIFNQDLRLEVLASLSQIDYVAKVDSDSAVESIRIIKPDFYIKGPDYKKRKVTTRIPQKLLSEQEAVKAVGGKLVFTDDAIIFSSSKLINDYFDVFSKETKIYLDSLRNKFHIDDVLEKLSVIENLKIMIIGDTIIDQYHYCLPMGKSSKEPIIVHRHIDQESFLGGTLATANHVTALSRKVTLITVLGKKKSYLTYIKKGMNPNVNLKFFFRNDADTIVKTRFIDMVTRQKLFQISYLKDDYIAKKLENDILKYLKDEVGKYDLVIVNDFGHGMMTDRLIKLICTKSKYLALNVQANSANYGFNIITKYPKANFVCIDDQELRLATHDKYSTLVTLVKKIYRKLKCEDIIVTKGPEGSISYSDNRGLLSAPTLTQKIVDRVGAGDALFAITAPCVAAGIDKDLVAFLGNVAGALKVQTVGNRTPILFPDLVNFMTRLLK